MLQSVFSICMRRTELPKRWNEGDSNWVAKSPLSSWQLTCIGQPDQVSHSLIFPSTFSLPLQDVPQPKPLALSKLGGRGGRAFWSRPASSIWRFRRHGDDEIRWYDELRWNSMKYDDWVDQTIKLLMLGSGSHLDHFGSQSQRPSRWWCNERVGIGALGHFVLEALPLCQLVLALRTFAALPTGDPEP